MFWKRKGHKYRTLDNDTVASNPSHIILNPLVWFQHDRLKILFHLSLLVFSVVASFVSSYFYLIFSFLTLRLIFLYWIEIEEKFQANSIIGQVISLSPPLAAVYSDLSNSGSYYPAIKIIPIKLKRDITLGEMIATVAVYYGTTDENHPYWKDFLPLPAEYATEDAQQLKHALDSYDEEGWKELTVGLKQIPQPYKPGLYKIHLNNSAWPTKVD